MNLHEGLRLRFQSSSSHLFQTAPPHHLCLFSPFLRVPNLPLSSSIAISVSRTISLPPLLLSRPNSKLNRGKISKIGGPLWTSKEEKEEEEDPNDELDYLAPDGGVYQKTLRLVECSMFAALSGLAYLLSNSLGFESYFSCFFALPIVVSAMRWGVAGGRKTMVATAVLLFILAGPVKALTYLLMHGLVGVAMGSMWRLRASWILSILICTFVRAMGAMGYLAVSSFLIRENILNLITINLHAIVTYCVTSLGIFAIPSMKIIYSIFATVLLLNCIFFVFLLHLLYAIFFTRLGMKSSLNLPRWMEKAI